MEAILVLLSNALRAADRHHRAQRHFERQRAARARHRAAIRRVEPVTMRTGFTLEFERRLGLRG